MPRTVRFAAVLAILALVVFLLTPPALVNSAPVPALPDDLDGYLASTERAAAEHYPLVPGTEKHIRWQVKGQKTGYAIVYLHGFSASRREISPTAEIVADAIGANLFETRLHGHGRAEGALEETSAEDWVEDAVEALTIGSRIGDRIILMGTSTGATLAFAMAGHPAMHDVESIVAISPNFGPHDPDSVWLTRPAGPLIARSLLGDTRSWEPRNEKQALYWSTSYPTQAIVEVMRLVDLARSKLPLELDQCLLVLFSPHDDVVSPQRMQDALNRITAPRKELRPFDAVGDASNHVLSGDIVSPGNTAAVVETILGFLRGTQ